MLSQSLLLLLSTVINNGNVWNEKARCNGCNLPGCVNAQHTISGRNMMDQHHGTVATPNVLEHNGIACMHIEASLEHADQILVQIDIEQVTCIAGRLVE